MSKATTFKVNRGKMPTQGLRRCGRPMSNLSIAILALKPGEWIDGLNGITKETLNSRLLHLKHNHALNRAVGYRTTEDGKLIVVYPKAKP